MKAFSCGDVVPGCQAHWLCPTDDDVLAQVAAHARDVHGIVQVSPELVQQVRDRILTSA